MNLDLPGAREPGASRSSVMGLSSGSTAPEGSPLDHSFSLTPTLSRWERGPTGALPRRPHTASALRGACRNGALAGWLPVLAALVALALLLHGRGPRAHAQSEPSGPVEVLSSSAVSEFPEGIRFRLEARGPVKEVLVRFAGRGQRASQYDYLDVSPAEGPGGPTSSAELFYATNTAGRYIPPGVTIEYHFELTDDAGRTVETEPQELLLLDSRFEWDSVSEGQVTVLYHGPVGTRARSMLDASLQTIEAMGPILGVVDDDRPITVTMYNNNAEMFDASVPRSGAISRELVTEGQAFSDRGVVIMNGNSQRATGTMSHELTHILLGRAVSGARTSLPAWLNEGIAEYANIDPGVSYQRYLEWAIDTHRLQPLTALDAFPGDPDMVIVAYGQSRSVVAFLIEGFGRGTMAAFLAEYNSTRNLDTALETVYGFDRAGLDEAWREAVGADPYVEATPKPLPTVKPLPTLAPYSLTPAAATATPPEAEPTPSPEPAPTATAEAPASGGGCSAPGGDPPIEASSLLLLAAAAAGAYRSARRAR